MTAQSTISATLEFSLPALDRALERRVPRRLATFNDRTASCWHRRILGREIEVDCTYSGFVERIGPISLRAENGRLSAAASLYGMASGQGTRRFARLLHGTAAGQMMVYATARPRLRSDWVVSLNMSEGVRWEQPPILTILGFPINLTRFVEPRIRSQLRRVQADASASLRMLDVRGKAEASWRKAFGAVKIVDAPEVWLRMTPQKVAFAGTHAHGNVLEGSLEIAGVTATSVGAEPTANTPTPLPSLGTDVTEPGHFEIVVPVSINYDSIRAKVQDVMSAMNSAGFALREVEVYPSATKMVLGLRLAAPEGHAEDGDWIYLTATPRVNAQSQTIQFPDLAFSMRSQPAPPSMSSLFKDDSFIQKLQQQLRVDYQAELDKIVSSANERLTRSLGDGLRSEARLTSSGVPNIQLLPEELRLDFRADGYLKILYGL
jgi:Domain of unknown function (DUF4403)